MKLKPINITVNGKPCTVWESPITIADIIDLVGVEMPDEWKKGPEGQQKVAVMSGTQLDVAKK